MSDDDIALMQAQLKSTREDLKNTQLVLATLITWLQREIGREGATRLINDLQTLGRDPALDVITSREVVWHSFDPFRGHDQKLPPLKRYVLVQLANNPADGLPASVAVGYIRLSADESSEPYFIVPGIGGQVVYWSDCLGDDFAAPLWEGKQCKA